MIDFDKRLRSKGFLEVDRILTHAELCILQPAIEDAAPSSAGDRRMLDHSWCRDLSRLLLRRVERRSLVAGDFVGVLCTFFDKSERSNWGVAPHRDLAVPVREKTHTKGFTNWSTKQDIPHAHAPRQLLERMFSLRLNIDPSAAENGALMVAPGSHRSIESTTPNRTVEGEPGDGLLMSPLIVHASRKSVSQSPRRVLHFLFGPRHACDSAEWFYAV